MYYISGCVDQVVSGLYGVYGHAQSISNDINVWKKWETTFVWYALKAYRVKKPWEWCDQ